MKKLIPIAALILAFCSCTKSKSSDDPIKTDSIPNQLPEVAVPVDVYLGLTSGTVDSSQAAYWKNGTIYPVSEQHYGWYGISVFAVGSDVYVCGGERDTVGYWKNGDFTAVLRPEKSAVANGMAFLGQDRYEVCTGYDINGVPTGGLFKNDQLQLSGSFSGVVVSGSDVYLYGSTSYNGHVAAALWKNGSLQQLDNGNNASFVNSLAVSGSNAYACGYEIDASGHAIAHFWRNGVDSLLSDASGITVPEHISLSSGGNLYMCGYSMSGTFHNPGGDGKAVFWKNGSRVDWNVPAGTIRAQDMAVNGPDIYLILDIPTSDPAIDNNVLWKNGEMTAIGQAGQHISVNTITLVKK